MQQRSTGFADVGGRSAEYGSGLPIVFTGTYDDALAQYGQSVVDRIDFVHHRVRPSLAIGASLGTDVFKNDKLSIKLQADALNLKQSLECDQLRWLVLRECDRAAKKLRPTPASDVLISSP